MKYRTFLRKLDVIENDLGYKITKENIKDIKVQRDIFHIPSVGRAFFNTLEIHLGTANKFLLAETPKAKLEEMGIEFENK